MPEEIITNDRFSPSSHFFTDALSILQNANQAFGPVSEDVFRLTSKFTATAGAKAYAICKGTVCIQPQTGNVDKVNLILRPYTQPLQGVNIRYFIYRGLNKSEFFTSGNKVIPATSGTSDLINKINEEFLAFHAGEEETPEFEAAFLGYFPSPTDGASSIDSRFFKITEVVVNEEDEEEESADSAYELPLIFAGKSLGTFSTGECGIDVVLNYGDYSIQEDLSLFDLNLDYARKPEAKIDLTAVTDAFERKQMKEQIFQFIDIAAYYGFHNTATGQVFVHGSETPLLPAAIYTDVLTPFSTKNTYYLYIQSDRERSYDFYGNYRIDEEETENMLYGLTDTTLAARDYGTNGWPLIIEITAQDHAEERNKIFLQLVTDNNPNTVLYGQTACVDNAQRNYFSGIDVLRIPLDEDEDPSNLTTTIIISNPAVTEASTKKHVANFGILIYQGAVYEFISGTTTNQDEEEENVYSTPNFFDDVFGNILAEPLLKSENEAFYSITVLERLKLVNHFLNSKQLGISAIQSITVRDTIETKIVEEPHLERVAYITETVAVSSDVLYPFKKPSQFIETTASVNNQTGNSPTYNFPANYSIRTTSFTDGLNPVNGVELRSKDGSQINKIVLGISKVENDLLTSIMDTNALINARIFLIDLFNGDDRFISKEKVKYRKYRLAVVGEVSTGILKIFEPAERILIYSLDNYFHFSESYSRYVTSVPSDLMITGTPKEYDLTNIITT